MPIDFNEVPSGGPRPFDPAEWDRRVEKVRAALRSRAREFVSQLYPHARFQRGQARLGSINGDKGESFVIEVEGDKAGVWYEHGTDGGAKDRGDLIELWRHDRGCDFNTAMVELEQWLGLNPGQPAWTSKVKRIAEERKRVYDATPKEPDPVEINRERYIYQDATADHILAVIHRINYDNGTKDYRQQRMKADGSGLEWGSVEHDRPLYRLPQIAGQGVVVLVEGEKSADALNAEGVPATSLMGGSNTIIEKTDLRPLAGKTVLLWPDNDAGGFAFMQRLEPHLRQLGCSVVTLAIPPGKPEKWDAADAEAGEAKALLSSLLDKLGENPPAGGKFRFAVTMYQDIAEEHTKAWLVDDFLGAGELTVVYGAPGCGKSVLMGDAVCHVAAGLPWFEHDVTECAVLYIAAERAALVKRRLAAWRKRHGVLDIPVAVVEGLFNLTSAPVDADEIGRIMEDVAELTGKQVRWVVVDTKAQVMGGADENSAKDVSAFVNNLSKFQARGAHVTVIDHTPHTDPGRMRGSSALAGAADGSYLVTKEGAIRKLSVGAKPPNDGPDEFSVEFELESVVLGFSDKGKPTTAPVVVAAKSVSVEALKVSSAAHQIHAIQDVIARGDWRLDTRSPEWAGVAVAQVHGVDVEDKQGKKWVAQELANLIAEGLLFTSKSKDDRGREKVFVKVGRRVSS